MSYTLPLIEPQVLLQEQANGDLVLQNKVPLAPHPRNLVSWLRRNAERFPTKPFLQERDANGEWKGVTFAETEALVNRVSNAIVALGLDVKAPIAILSENSINMALIQLAAMQIGKPVAPVSFAYSVRSQTGSHIKHILDVTQAPVLVMSNAALHMPLISQWETTGLQLFAFSHSDAYPMVQSFSELFAPERGDTLSEEAQARFDAVTHDTIAKIQFTSGSTNLPKGVIVTHGMMTSNQAGIAQMWPFVDSDERMVDFLPWSHTFGGNFVFNLALLHGCTFSIDDGNQTPAGLEKTVQNILDVRPTIYFGVPRSYTALFARMQTDTHLKQTFFRNLKCMFTAAAALDQETYAGMKSMSAEVRGAAIPFFVGWGSTETAPGATLVYATTDDARVIGLPLPGVNIKLANVRAGKRELRVKESNVTPGYYNDPAATTAAFDEEGYYCTGDAGRFFNSDAPAEGLMYDGRIGEDFKLSNGVWVQNANLRTSINRLGQPFLLDLVVAAPDRDYLTALVFPNVPALRARFGETAALHSEGTAFLQSDAVINLFREIFQQHNAGVNGSSRCFERFTILAIPPQIDTHEMTDKGYINQQAVLANRADQVAKLYQEPPSYGAVTISKSALDPPQGQGSHPPHERPDQPVVICGEGLTISEIARVSLGANMRLTLETGVLKRVQASHDYVMQAVKNNYPIYGITTGFGGMANVVISSEEAAELQNNLPWFLKAGAGSRLPIADVRASMLLRANSLLRGISGIRLEIIHRLETFLNAGVTPHVYEFGSIGASGDLVPLAYIAGAIIGLDARYTVDFRGENVDCLTALERLGLPRLRLAPKEGLALVNGTSVMTGIAANCVFRAQQLLALTMGAQALMLQGLYATNQSFHPFIHQHKPHPGQLWSAQVMLELLAGSQLIRDELARHQRQHRGPGLIQDRYSLRCLAQYLGPIVDGLSQIGQQVQIEANSATDNPLVDESVPITYHCGNFLGQYIGVAMDQLRYHLGLMAKHLDVQIALLVAPEFSNGLSPSLVGNLERRVNMGLKGLQLSGNSLMPLLLFYGNSLVDRFPTHAEQFNQNVNSQGFGSANLARHSIDMFEHYMAIALMFGIQAVDLRTHGVAGHYDARACLSPATTQLYEAVRQVIGRAPSPLRPYVWNDDEQGLDEHIASIVTDLKNMGRIPQAVSQICQSLSGHKP